MKYTGTAIFRMMVVITNQHRYGSGDKLQFRISQWNAIAIIRVNILP